MEQIIKHGSKMKPTNQEWIAITAMVFGAIGFVLGSLSDKDRVDQAEFERNLLLIHTEEIMELNDQLMLDALNNHSIQNKPLSIIESDSDR